VILEIEACTGLIRKVVKRLGFLSARGVPWMRNDAQPQNHLKRRGTHVAYSFCSMDSSWEPERQKMFAKNRKL
jgi:hypothetical protein